MTYPSDPLQQALLDLNSAAYAAIRAGRDTTEHPDLNRQALREIAAMTDRLLDSRGEEA